MFCKNVGAKTQSGPTVHKRLACSFIFMRTIDTGGAGPISALLEAARMVRVERCNAVAVVAGDAVSSMPAADFLRRADAGCADPDGSMIPLGGLTGTTGWRGGTMGGVPEDWPKEEVVIYFPQRFESHFSILGPGASPLPP